MKPQDDLCTCTKTKFWKIRCNLVFALLLIAKEYDNGCNRNMELGL